MRTTNSFGSKILSSSHFCKHAIRLHTHNKNYILPNDTFLILIFSSLSKEKSLYVIHFFVLDQFSVHKIYKQRNGADSGAGHDVFSKYRTANTQIRQIF